MFAAPPFGPAKVLKEKNDSDDGSNMDGHSQVSGRRSSETGAVLLIVMLVMIGLLGLGVTALWLTTGNLQISGNMNQRQQALVVAEAGLERAMAALNAPVAPDLNTLLNPSSTLAGVAGMQGDNRPTGIDSAGMPNGVGALFRDLNVPLQNIPFPPASFNRNAGTADSPTQTLMGTYTVWIRNDGAEIRLGQYITDGGNQSVVLRAVGLAVDGRTQVAIEVPLGPRGPSGRPPVPPTPAELCYSGKNACDDNSGTASGVVAGP